MTYLIDAISCWLPSLTNVTSITSFLSSPSLKSINSYTQTEYYIKDVRGEPILSILSVLVKSSVMSWKAHSNQLPFPHPHFYLTILFVGNNNSVSFIIGISVKTCHKCSCNDLSCNDLNGQRVVFKRNQQQQGL